MKYSRLLLFFLVFSLYSVSTINSQPRIGSSEKRISQNKSLAANCSQGNTSTMIELNNVRALIHTGGDMWWDFQKAVYEIPKDSGKTALWTGSIWIGGVDVNDQLKLAALRYRSNGVDYWPGPLIIEGRGRGTTNSEVCYQYDKHWEISRYQVSDFRDWYNASDEEKSREWEGYTIPSVILNWPAHGNVAEGYAYNMAPWYDNNEDGIYNPGDGDYPFYDLDGELPCGTTRELRMPRLYGDATLWWVYNDRGNVHQETNGEAIGMELRAQAFEFSTNDALNDMSFYNYEIINRSTYTLLETYFGVFTDGALGYAWDDFAGCHVQKGLGYFYNGNDVDGTGQYE
ncbi:T9SS C-terminal target domain-containing protein, partial [Bacteroidota bacterium]